MSSVRVTYWECRRHEIFIDRHPLISSAHLWAAKHMPLLTELGAFSWFGL